MEENKKLKEQNNNNKQRELDKNKTLDKPGTDVIDYGRSEQNAVKESQAGQERHSENDSERK